jgi:glycosyltransferase involved in cell wall biosynthesis
MSIEISFVIFGKDVGEDLMKTIQTVNQVGNQLATNFQIVVVDDGSKEPIKPTSIREQFSKVSNVLLLENSIGVSGAITEALPHCKYKYILPVPGHNMFSRKAIENVVRLTGQARLIIGCRNNLAQERPPIKKMASRILRDIYRHLTFYFVGDIHGLILYEKKDLLNFLPRNGGHANAIRVVTSVLVEGGLLIQTMAPINSGHDKRSSRKLIHSFPAPSNVLVVINALKWARKLYKGSI